MQITPYLLKSINLLNLGLLAITAAGIAGAVVPLTDISVNVTPPAMTEVNTQQAPPATAGNPAPAYADYALTAEQNIFHPTRKIHKAEQALPRPDVLLYGTLITDGIMIAYVEDKNAPRTTPGRGKRQIALKKGEALSGYVLKEVGRDRIEMVKGDDRMVVYLIDQKKARSEDTTKAAASPAAPPPAVRPAAQPAVQPRAMPGSANPAVQSAPQPTVQPRTMPATRAPRTAPRP